MGLTLVTNPVGSGASKIFAGFQKCEFVFKREDIAVLTVVSGSGGSKITHAGDLSSVLSAGDTIYLYSEATSYTYNGSFEIISIVAGEIVVDTPFIESGSGGYMNYLKNYYVELQCVNSAYPDANLLPFSLESDGDAAGNILIDVSIMNQLNEQRGAITQEYIDESTQEFEVKYRQVYSGSSESFTLVDNKLLIMLYAIDTPEEDEILNSFDIPKIYLGYDAALCIAITERAASSTIEMVYNELNINQQLVKSDSLGLQDSDVNGFLIWKWLEAATVEDSTKYLEFDIVDNSIYDFVDGDFDYPDFVTQ